MKNPFVCFLRNKKHFHHLLKQHIQESIGIITSDYKVSQRLTWEISFIHQIACKENAITRKRTYLNSSEKQSARSLTSKFQIQYLSARARNCRENQWTLDFISKFDVKNRIPYTWPKSGKNVKHHLHLRRKIISLL